MAQRKGHFGAKECKETQGNDSQELPPHHTPRRPSWPKLRKPADTLQIVPEFWTELEQNQIELGTEADCSPANFHLSVNLPNKLANKFLRE